MAEKEKKDKGENPAEGGGAAPEAAPAKKGLPLKTIIIVAALMLVEGVGVFFVLGALGGPKQSKADVKTLVDDHSEETEEIRLLEKEDEKFQNLASGQVWVWNVSVVLQVKSKNTERVKTRVENRSAEIKEGLSQIIGRAQIAQLKEPERQSLKRQVTALLEKIIGQDSDGKSLIESVLIPTCSGYPANF